MSVKAHRVISVMYIAIIIICEKLNIRNERGGGGGGSHMKKM